MTKIETGCKAVALKKAEIASMIFGLKEDMDAARRLGETSQKYFDGCESVLRDLEEQLSLA